ncbi:MAG: phytanoyl-CoA dioxygenase family protein [Chloroflexota bacterium]
MFINWSKEDLPKPTTDLDVAKANITQYGYCLIKNALEGDELKAIRRRLEDQAIAEKQLGMAYEDGGAEQNWGDFRDEDGNLILDAFTEEAGGVNQRIWMLINKGKVFCDMLLNPKVHAILKFMLGEDYLLSSHGANIAKPGGVEMHLHTDQWWMPGPVSPQNDVVPVGSISRQQSNVHGVEDLPMIAPPAAVNVLWMIGDFSEENGGTRVVPGSHLSGRQPVEFSEQDVKSVGAEGPAGTALMIDARIWHGTGANVSNDLRWAVLSTFCGPQFRTQENFTLGTSPEVVAEASPELLTLFGFNVWNAYGRTDDPVVEYVQPGKYSIGELQPK